MCWLSVKFVKAKVICYIFIYKIMLSEETAICFQVFTPMFSQGSCCFLDERSGAGWLGGCGLHACVWLNQ